MEGLTRDPKQARPSCGSFLRKGEVFAYVGLNQKLKDLKDLNKLREQHCPYWSHWVLRAIGWRGDLMQNSFLFAST